MRGHNILITEAELIASSPERVYSVLEARAAKMDKNDASFDKETERGMLDRNDQLIDLALARFARYDDTAESLFTRASTINHDHPHERALRLAILGNEHLDGTFSFSGVPVALFERRSDALAAWLSEATDGEMLALFTNPSINQSFLRDFARVSVRRRSPPD